jgi:hypothetical protein
MSVACNQQTIRSADGGAVAAEFLGFESFVAIVGDRRRPTYVWASAY